MSAGYSEFLLRQFRVGGIRIEGKVCTFAARARSRIALHDVGAIVAQNSSHGEFPPELSKDSTPSKNIQLSIFEQLQNIPMAG